MALHERLNRLAGDHAPGWVPAVDLCETADQYVIAVELPGLTRDDFQISIQDGKLVLRGQRQPRQIAGDQFHRVERGHGQFARSFALPHPIDEKGITADLCAGILTITIPKAVARPRTIEVR
jgi:HSP20 family protein